MNQAVAPNVPAPHRAIGGEHHREITETDLGHMVGQSTRFGSDKSGLLILLTTAAVLLAHPGVGANN